MKASLVWMLGLILDSWCELQVNRSTVLLLLALALSAQLCAEHGPEHGLTERELGAVHFPTSCAPAVQNEFERGVALLHSFAFETAEATFRQVAQHDPKCAMAHWGIGEVSGDGGCPMRQFARTIGMKRHSQIL